jgi:dCTP deaminase
MVLTKTDILRAIEDGKLAFSPELDGFQVQPHAIDLRLGFDFRLAKTWRLTEAGRQAVTVDPLGAANNNFENIVLKQGQYFELLPKEFVIAVTLEEVTLNADNLMAVLYPRSSINRRGLAVDLSGIIDVGYSGKLMIPIMNNTSEQIIRVYPGERICQIVFQTLSQCVDMADAQQHGLSKAKYHGNEDIMSKADTEIERELLLAGKIEELKERYKI